MGIDLKSFMDQIEVAAPIWYSVIPLNARSRDLPGDGVIHFTMCHEYTDRTTAEREVVAVWRVIEGLGRRTFIRHAPDVTESCFFETEKTTFLGYIRCTICPEPGDIVERQKEEAPILYGFGV